MSEKMLGNENAARWMPAHDAALKRLREEHFSASEIAPQINREFQTGYSRNAVIGRLHRLGLTTLNRQYRPRETKIYKPRVRKPIIPKFSAEEVALRCIEIAPRNLSLLELEPNDCRYPYGDGPFTFCGHPKMEGRNYCVPHFHLSIGPGTTSERRATS